MNEYNEYYGFWLEYKNHRISTSKPLKHTPEGDDICGPNKVYVRCGKCLEYMQWTENGYLCRHCGAKVRQSTVYGQIQKENEAFLKSLDYDDIYE